MELLLTFRPEQLFEHFIGRRDDLGCGRKSPLHHDHLGELLPDIDGRLLQRGLTDSATTPRMSAFGGKAEVIQGVAECPLIANSGHSALPLLLFIDHSFDRMRSGKWAKWKMSAEL